METRNEERVYIFFLIYSTNQLGVTATCRTSSVAAHPPRFSSPVEADGFHVVESRRWWRSRFVDGQGSHARCHQASSACAPTVCLRITSRRNAISPHAVYIAGARSTALGHASVEDRRPGPRCVGKATGHGGSAGSLLAGLQALRHLIVPSRGGDVPPAVRCSRL